MQRFAFTFAVILIAGAVAAGTPSETVGAAGVNQDSANGIVVPSGTRIEGGSVSSERIDTHRCRSNVVVINMAMTGGGRLTRVTIDGRQIARRRLAAINAILATFERPSEVYVNCYPTSYSLTLRQVEWARTTREEHVDLLLPADRR